MFVLGGDNDPGYDRYLLKINETSKNKYNCFVYVLIENCILQLNFLLLF